MTRHLNSLTHFALALVIASGLMIGASNASYAAPTSGQEAIADPIEPFNRAVTEFNRVTDILVMRPVSEAYTWLLPVFVRDGVRNFLSNLASPVSFLNEILQGDFNGAYSVASRFALNSTIGAVGMVDVAEHHGFERLDPEDFGQTLGVWGIGHGFYIVLPLLGPTSLRDGVGRVVDMVTDPYALWANDTENDVAAVSRTALGAISARSDLLGTLEPIYDESVDPYISLKSFYEQYRFQVLHDQNPHHVANNQNATLSFDAYDQYDTDF